MGYSPEAWDFFGGSIAAIAVVLIPAVVSSLVGGVLDTWLFPVRLPG